MKEKKTMRLDRKIQRQKEIELGKEREIKKIKSERETERHTARERDRERGRQTQREIE